MRKPILLFCAIILLFCFWLLLHGRKERGGDSLAEVQSPLTNQQPVIQANTPPAPSPGISNPSAASTAEAEARYRATPEGSNALQQRILNQWQKPIEFYGKVIDENSNPVVAAKIHFRWIATPYENGEETVDTESDSEGLFSLQGKSGASLTIWYGKEGYYSSSGGQMSFNYALGPDVISPDPLNPIIFHLRKKGEGANLIQNSFPPGFGQIWQLHHDGTPIELDLLKGSENITGSGQLTLELWRDISDMNKQPFDWKLQISIPGGGLVPTDQEFAFEAPQSGYQPSIIIDMPATNQDWTGELRTKYYIQLPNGDYGRFDLYLLSRNGVFTVNSAVNPTGSQNLEPAQ